jgi:phosphate-selective porin OprO/OprP
MTRLLRAAVTIALGLALAGVAPFAADTASAQGFFFKEVEKEGRIYVFNIGAEYERWLASGEAGRSITKLGYGPNGETVVFDSEQAIDLYNFRHGIAEVVERPRPPRLELVWRDGKTRITTDAAYLEISTRLQGRYSHELPDDSVQLAGTATRGDDRGSFRIRRAKFKLEGSALQPWLTYEFQLNVPAVTGANPGALLEDAVVDWDVTKGRNALRLRFGQSKAAFGRQELTSSGSQSFVDRAEVSNQYSPGRETGFGIWGTSASNRWEWRATVSNGNSMTRSANDNDAFLWTARVMFQPSGRQALAQRAWVSGPFYSEGAFDAPEFPLFAIALSAMQNDFHRATTSNDLKDRAVGVDVVYKFRRLFLTGEGYLRTRRPETGPSFDSNGFFAQAGYLFSPGKSWEIAARYGVFDPTDAVPNNARREWRAGLSYYYSRHTLKVQADFGELRDRAGNGGRGARNRELRVQSQIVF